MDAPLPALAGVADGAYDLIAMLDVLEHLDDDRDALVSLARKLKPGGRILITVPAFPWMWSATTRSTTTSAATRCERWRRPLPRRASSSR